MTQNTLINNSLPLNSSEISKQENDEKTEISTENQQETTKISSQKVVPAANEVELPMIFLDFLANKTEKVYTREFQPKSLMDEPLLLKSFISKGLSLKQATRQAKMIWRLIVQHGIVSDKDLMEKLHSLPESTKLGKIAMEVMESGEFTIFTTKLIKRTEASDGSSTKLLLQLQSGEQMEAVVLRYGETLLRNFPNKEKVKDGKFKSNRRTTLCVSSQVGCAQGCTFCATGTMGLLLNLTPGEILEQVLWANLIERERLGNQEDVHVRNVVFMGMGEPLDNYDTVVTAIRAMVDTSRFGMAAKRISLSTVLRHPRLLDRILRDLPMVSLAFSLHAPTQDVRQKIVPSAKGWKLDKGMEALWKFTQGQEEYWQEWKNQASRQRNHEVGHVESPRVLIEYILLKDLNCTKEMAVKLGQMLQDRPVILNLIPYNPVSVITQLYGYQPPLQQDIDEFVEELRKVPGLIVHVRQELGQDVGAACGQLVVENVGVKPIKKQRIRDLEDLGGGKRGTEKATEKATNSKVVPLVPLKDNTMEFLLLLAILITAWIVKIILKSILFK